MTRATLYLGLLAAGACTPVLESPTPSLDGVDPNLVCNDQRPTTVTISGAGLTPTPVDALTETPRVALPDLALVLATDLAGGAATGEVDLDASQATTIHWADSEHMSFDVTPELALGAGVYTVSATNADGQAATLDSAFVVTNPPVLTGVVPQVFCTEQGDTVLTLTGTDFLVVGATMPTVAIGDWTTPADAANGCTALAGPVQGQVCTELTVTVPAEALPPAVYSVSVTNPAPADCVSSEAFEVQIVSAPVIDAIVPPDVCVDAPDLPVEVQGDGFLLLDGAEPTVFVGADAYAPDSLDGCTDLLGPTPGQICTTLTFTLPSATYAIGSYDVVIENPAPADCVTSEPAVLEIIAPPEIAAITPSAICDSGGTFTITGTGFIDGAEVTVGGVAATTVTFVSETELTVTVSSLPTGFQDVTVTNPDGCTVTEAAGIEIVPAPLLFYVDPPVIYSGVTLEATLYVAGVTGTITDVYLEEASSGTVTTLVFDATNPEQIRATIPSGLPEGDYDVFLLQDGSCPAFLDTGLFVEADLTIDLEAIDPGFAWTGDDTPVVITAVDPVSTGMVQLADLPRVYLSPTTSSGSATALRSVAFKDATRIDAVIPEGLSVDVYDVIVVNPDGSVGLLAAALEVVTDAPPRVDSVSPASLPNNTTGPITVFGANFRDPTVDFDCDDLSGVITSAAGTVSASTSGTITVEVPTSTLGNGVCVVTVTNSDGTWVEWSAMSITNPSQNLFPWEAGATLTTPRRAPAAIAGRATSAARYLYAIGGDDGAAAGAYDSIEYTSVDKFGNMGFWAPLPGTLPDARTLAAITRIGRFVYLVGGHDGTAPVDTVWRAQVLDPLMAPEFADLSIAYGTGVEMGGGTWIYRVAALFDATDDTNPSGESLASDPIVVRLPDVSDRIVLTVGWSAVPNAVGYRIYRTPAADAGSGTEEWLDDVSGGTTLTYADDGGTTDPSMKPLPSGALGEWATVATLPRALQSPCVTTGADPSDAAVTYLYVAGGRDGGGSIRNEVLFVDVTEVSEHEQDVGTFATSTNTITAAYECGAWAVDPTLHSKAPVGESWAYFGGGRTASSTTGSVRSGLVTAGGELTSWSTVSSMSPTRAGFGFASASNYLYAVGGQNAGPSSSGASSAVTGPPDLGNWNSLGGGSISTGRYLMGSAQESAVIFIVGGQTSSAAATDTTEQTSF